jgi:hypothetical protein
MSRAGRWPESLRWIVRRTRPSRRQMKNLTAYEKATGWRYFVICTDVPSAGVPGVPGSHHPQYIDALHREHAVVEDQVRTGKAMGLRNLPSKTWQVNCGWVLAANAACASEVTLLASVTGTFPAIAPVITPQPDSLPLPAAALAAGPAAVVPTGSP